MENYEMTVGLEVHAELCTKTKIFCACPTDFGAPPNTQICPICMGLPGTLPSLNRKVVEFAIKAGLATGCRIAHRSGIDRKNYFYPDLPKGYQISQYARPICYDGCIEFELGADRTRVEIERIHIEEDAGKLIHDKTDQSLVDFNRCGRPLIEIVSKPQIHSSEGARAYLKKLRTLLLAVGVSDCKMNEGSLRCDVNISVRKVGDECLGERTEIKNLNSFSFVAKAIESEFRRQCEILDAGEQVSRQTLRYNASTGKCEVMRSKESTVDYRFFPEPDLHDVMITDEDIERVRTEIPILPDARRVVYTESLGLSDYDAAILSSDIGLSNYFDMAQRHTKYKKQLANLLISEVMRLVEGEDFFCPISAERLAELCELVGEEEINSSTAKKLLARMWNDDKLMPKETVEREDLSQINDESEIRKLAKAAIEKNPKAVEDYRNGKSFAIRSIIGKAMAASAGRANPRIVEEMILREIK
jgi:aspartyl-tRNA(Asn)/glutamyl-tRNA(Gln) amidotransferase subunit B